MYTKCTWLSCESVLYKIEEVAPERFLGSILGWLCLLEFEEYFAKFGEIFAYGSDIHWRVFGCGFRNLMKLLDLEI
jgi:hypothetical protein